MLSCLYIALVSRCVSVFSIFSVSRVFWIICHKNRLKPINNCYNFIFIWFCSWKDPSWIIPSQGTSFFQLMKSLIYFEEFRSIFFALPSRQYTTSEQEDKGEGIGWLETRRIWNITIDNLNSWWIWIRYWLHNGRDIMRGLS